MAAATMRNTDGGGHQHLRLLRLGAQRADAHASNASEVEKNAVAEAVSNFVVERHTGEGGEGEQGPHRKNALVVVEFPPHSSSALCAIFRPLPASA
jgi:hypothetical protein